MSPPILEICVDSPWCAINAVQAGADRIELCAGLGVGGTTPSAGAIQQCRAAVRAPLHVMVRPRGGDFVYDRSEIEWMISDIDFAGAAGADGIVLGAMTEDGRVDVRAMKLLVAEARPQSVTFHRAFDAARDADEALDALLDLGVDRVLTSGRARTAREGSATLARMVERAGDRLTVMAGGGVRAEGVQHLVTATGVREVHARPVERKAWRGYHNMETNLERSGPMERAPGHDVIDVDAVRRLRAALDGGGG